MFNRSFKFRAWDLDACMMREVLNLSFDEHGDISEITVKVGEAYSIGDHLLGTNNEEDRLAGIPCAAGMRYVLMQFTGLQDKNGVDIYEDDIVLLPDTDECVDACCVRVADRWRSEVKWNSFYAKFVINNHGRNTKVEIIGNIYQPPVMVQTIEGQSEVAQGVA